jgi:hypothetical protein
MKNAWQLAFAIGLALAQRGAAVEEPPNAPPPSAKKADQTIDFHPLSEVYLSPYDLPLHAHASSDLPVVFSAKGPCSIVGSYLRMERLGECVVTADQPGDRNFNPAPSVRRTIEIILQPPPPP